MQFVDRLTEFIGRGVDAFEGRSSHSRPPEVKVTVQSARTSIMSSTTAIYV